MRLASFVFVGTAFGRVRFEQIYALGDSITDIGNYYAISGNTYPSSDYYKGRFSNGPTWIEYLASILKANVRVYAFGKATSDNHEFEADENLDVPGCIQQADFFLTEYNAKERSKAQLADHALVSLAFLGNDFFNPQAAPIKTIRNLEKCANKILSGSSAKHMIIPVNSAPEIFPYFQTDPTLLERNTRFAQELAILWKAALLRLKAKHKRVQFYPFNFRDTLLSVKNGTSPFQKTKFDSVTPCLVPGKKRCSDPANHMFFDLLHPTTQVHQIIAKSAARILPL